METDRELLRRYGHEGDEAAFAEVVRRHTDLVYSVALRLVAGDAPLAQDVAQSVFTALAQKARTLSHRPNLIGWLHTTTRYAASVAVRGERRRRHHEQEASAMNHDLNSPAPEMDWPQLQPLLDEAVGRLREADREAVLLRFFQGKSHREVGAELGLTEVLARKRVERALDKLRMHLSRRGVTVSAAALGAAITTHSVQGAPVGLAAGMAHASLAQAAQIGVAGAFLKGLSMTTKTKMTLATAAMLILAAIPITLESRQITQASDENTEMVRQNSALQLEINQLGAKLRNARSGTPSGVATTGGSGSIPISLETIKGLMSGKNAVDTNLKLNDRVVTLLGMTPDESAEVQNILAELKSSFQTYESNALQEITPDQVSDQPPFDYNILNFLDKNPGHQTLYEIPPMDEDGRAALEQWFSDSITKTLGPDRGDILFQNVMTSTLGDFFLKPGVWGVFAFSDSLGDDGQTPKTVGAYTFNAGGEGMLGTGQHAYPDEWAFLFKDLRSSVPTPVAPQPKLSARESAITGNLRRIFEAAMVYMKKNNVAQVTYLDLTTGPDPAVTPVRTVSGENYEDIIVHETDKSLSVQSPSLGMVKFEP